MRTGEETGREGGPTRDREVDSSVCFGPGRGTRGGKVQFDFHMAQESDLFAVTVAVGVFFT